NFSIFSRIEPIRLGGVYGCVPDLKRHDSIQVVIQFGLSFRRKSIKASTIERKGFSLARTPTCAGIVRRTKPQGGALTVAQGSPSGRTLGIPCQPQTAPRRRCLTPQR